MKLSSKTGRIFLSTIAFTSLVFVNIAHAGIWDSVESPMSGQDYKRDSALTQGEVYEATVVQVRKVVLQSSAYASNVGLGTGGAIGGIAGASIGKKPATKAIGGILGAVIGAGVGQAAGEAISERNAGEVVLRGTDGKLLYIVQEDGMQFVPGEKVLLMKASNANLWTSTSSIRVAKMTALLQ